MITYILQGHTLQNDVQTMIQVFYPNLHYQKAEQTVQEGITVLSALQNQKATAMIYQNGRQIAKWEMPYTEPLSEKEQKRLVKLSIFALLSCETGIVPRWGLLTGVRPAKIVNMLLEEGKTEDDCMTYLTKQYLVSEQKAQLTITVAKAERRLLAENKQDDISLYVGIPFCPTRCLYCSFTAYPLAQYQKQVDAYLDAMFLELEYLAEYAKAFTLKNIYIGGGTPTSLDETQLERLLQKIKDLFAPDESMEYTVEAGRPDTITKEKLRLMKVYGVNRISINPQTMNDETLKRIGRKHDVADIIRVYEEARAVGHENINMDLILGLPEETPKDVKHTMQLIQKLKPDNVTVHTLAVKRASRLKQEFDMHTLSTAEMLEEMLHITAEYAKKMGLEPYYMYRQKNMVGNFENVGYCKPGKEGVYNIQIMEEKQTILAAGAGASTKTVDQKTNRIERVFNVKSIEDYIGRIDEMIERKRQGLPKGGNI